MKINTQKTENRFWGHFWMIFLVLVWGFDYIPAKFGLAYLDPLALVFFKYAIGLAVLLIVKVVTSNRNLIRLRDIPIFIVCSIFGEVLYFWCEYSAMDYMPVSLLTIILAFVPVVSIGIERVFFKTRSSKKVVIGALVCVVGVIIIIGADFRILFQGRIIGYLIAFAAVFSWNIYNYLTSSLEKYDSLTLTCMQMLCTLIITFPITFHSLPAPSDLTPDIIAWLVYLGVVDSALGSLIIVYAIKKLGPTTAALYTDFMPVSTTFFGFVILHESITSLQVLGGIIVILAGFVVIREKGKQISLQ